MVKTGSFKEVYIYSDHVVAKPISNIYSGCHWLEHIAELGLINAKYNAKENTWRMELLDVRTTHSEQVLEIISAYKRRDYSDVLRLFELYFPKWYHALKTFTDKYNDMVIIDFEERNFGYRENGDIVFFDIVDPLYDELLGDPLYDKLFGII